MKDYKIQISDLGYLWLIIFGDRAQIEDIFIDEQYRRIGLATKMMEIAEKLAAFNGCNLIQLTSQNPEAQKMYKKLGYKKIRAYRKKI